MRRKRQRAVVPGGGRGRGHGEGGAGSRRGRGRGHGEGREAQAILAEGCDLQSASSPGPPHASREATSQAALWAVVGLCDSIDLNTCLGIRSWPGEGTADPAGAGLREWAVPAASPGVRRVLEHPGRGAPTWTRGPPGSTTPRTTAPRRPTGAAPRTAPWQRPATTPDGETHSLACARSERVDAGRGPGTRLGAQAGVPGRASDPSTGERGRPAAASRRRRFLRLHPKNKRSHKG